MHHVVLDRWSRGSSPLHRRDPRVKLVTTLVFLVLLGTARQPLGALAIFDAILLGCAIGAARLPWAGVLARGAVVLPFTAVFAIASWLGGDPGRAMTLAAKSYLSAVAVLLLVGTTPLPALLGGAESLGAPRFLLMVIQFVYRYLFVISEQAQHMRSAAAARGGLRRAGFGAAAGALAVLFARAYDRASNIHRAMLARGFQGRFRTLESPRAGWADAVFGIGAISACAAARVLAGGIR